MPNMQDDRAAVEMLVRTRIPVPGVAPLFRSIWRLVDIFGSAPKTEAPRLEFPAPSKIRLNGVEFDVGFAVFAQTKVPTVVAHNDNFAKHFDVARDDVILQDMFSLVTKLPDHRRCFPELRKQIRSQLMRATKNVLLHGYNESPFYAMLQGNDDKLYTVAVCPSTVMVLDGSVYTIDWQIRHPGPASPTMEAALVHICRLFRDCTRARAHVRQMLSHTFNIEAPRRTSFFRPLGYVASRSRGRKPPRCVMDTRGGFVTLSFQSEDPDCETGSCPGELSENRVLELDDLITLKESGQVSLLMSQLDANSVWPSRRSRGSLGHPHTCKPCPFFCFQKDKWCVFGVLCDHCHGSHVSHRKSRRKARRAQKRRAKMIEDDQNKLTEDDHRLSGDKSATDGSDPEVTDMEDDQNNLTEDDQRSASAA